MRSDRGRPRRRCRRSRPGGSSHDRRTWSIDAGDGLPLTVAAPAPRASGRARPGEACSSATTTCSPTPRPTPGPRSLARALLAAGAGPRHARRAAAPQRRRLRGRLAGCGPDRRGDGPAQHVLDQRRAAPGCCAAPTSRSCSARDVYRSPPIRRDPAGRHRRSSTSPQPPPLLAAVGPGPAADRVHLGVPVAPIAAGRWPAAGGGGPRRCRRPRRGRGGRGRVRPHGHRPHVGIHRARRRA